MSWRPAMKALAVAIALGALVAISRSGRGGTRVGVDIPGIPTAIADESRMVLVVPGDHVREKRLAYVDAATGKIRSVTRAADFVALPSSPSQDAFLLRSADDRLLLTRVSPESTGRAQSTDPFCR